MGYLSTLSIGAFNKKAGRLIYYPWGVFGPGYEVQSWKSRRRLAALGRLGLPIYLFAVISATLLAGVAGLLAAIGAAVVIHASLVGSATRHMPRSPERLGFLENLRNQVRGRSLTALFATELVLLAVATFAAWYLSGRGATIGAGLAVIALFLPFLLMFALMIRERLRL